jgi:tripartite ATP-independent transporter DctM subunit
MTITIMLGLFAVLMCIGVPIAHAMGLAAVVALAIEGSVPLLLLAQRVHDSLDTFSLLAVPLFIIAGELMAVGGITERLVAMSRAWIGHVRGGLAQANVLTNMFMAAISGSALADLAAIGSMMIPAMKREGYRADFCVAVTSCAAMMAPIIPPSVIAVIYGSVTGVSIGALFLGGAIPGVVAGLAMMALTRHLAPRAGAAPLPRMARREAVAATGRALPALVMPVLIVGGILSGAFTPTEAGVVAALYALLFGLALGRHGPKSLYANLSSAASTTAAALITLAGAALFGWILARDGAGAAALQGMLAITDDRSVAMFILILFFFLIGTFLEPVPAMIITVPVMEPLIRHLGFDPVHVGIVIMMMLVVGSVTPPVGILAMVASRIAGVDYRHTFGMLWPYIAGWIAVVLLVAYNPWMVTWLPSML